MNVLSLFDGISCGRIALERASIKVDNYFASEIDKSAIEISKYNYPDIIQLGDVVNWKSWNLPKIDLIIGGSPCQGFSRNGKMLNFDDPRSKLFFEFVDIVNDIKRKNPNVLFLLENVKMKKEWANLITEYLGVDYIEINSKLVSAQNRQRYYWTNIEGVKNPNDRHVTLKDIVDEDDGFEYWEFNGIKLDKKYTMNNARLLENVNGELRIKQATKKGYIVPNDYDGITLAFPTSKSRRGRAVREKSPCLDCSCDVSVYYDNKIRHFTIEELEKLQTLPIGYTKCVSYTNAKKAIGNGWTVDVIAHIFSYINNKI